VRRTPTPFAALRALHPPAAACQLDAYFPGWTDGDWRLLRLEADDALEIANDHDPVLDYEPPKRHQPLGSGSTPAAISRKPGAVEFATGDPLKKIAPRTYVEALTGETVPATGWLSCPLPDHDDRTPSFQVLDTHWRCFGCNRGGGVIELGAALYGLEPRGQGYKEIRRRLLVDLGVGRPV
jgi:CHC2 zinc finger